jgi:propanol-preferring alcohol dehydrogenase
MVGKDVDGGFAEYVRVPAASVVKLPGKIPFEEGAIMGCAVSTAYHALRRGRVQQKDTVAIIGVGGVGMHAVQLAKKVFGAGEVIALDRFDWKLKQAKRFGANNTVNVATRDPAESMKRITDNAMADVVVDFVGSGRTIGQGVNCVGKGGRFVLVGIGAKSIQLSSYGTIIGREIEVVGVDDHLKIELIKLVNLVRSSRIDLSHSVTHRISLENINAGLGILEDRNEKTIRAVVLKEN